MSDLLTSYRSGYLATPVIDACRQRGLFQLLDGLEFRQRTWLQGELEANAGYFTIALDTLESLGWIERNAEDGYRLTGKGSSYPDRGLTQLYALQPGELVAHELHVRLLRERIEQLFLHSVNDEAALGDPARGAVIVPLVVALQGAADAEKVSEALDRLHPDLRGAVSELFIQHGWLSADGTELTASGQALLQRTDFTAAASYRPLLHTMGDLLFGDPAFDLRQGDSERRPITARSFRPATESDLDRLCELEELCWQHTRTTRERIRARLQRYPQGHFVLEMDARILGVIYSQRLADTEALLTRTAANVDELHDASGPIVQLLALNVDPQVQNLSYGDQLLEFMLQRCALIPGINRVVGVTLCKSYDAGVNGAFDEYIQQQGANQDPVLAFHEAHGAEVVRAIPGYRPEDLANLHHGVLVAYDILNRTPRHGRSRVERGVAAVATKVMIDGRQINESVRTEAARLLGIEASEVDVDRPVMEMGLDSADLLKLQRHCEAAFDLELEAGFFFEYSSLGRVIEYLTNRLAPAQEEEAQQPAGTGVAPSPTHMTLPAGDDKPAQEWASARDIAIVGMSCKLPGGIETPEQLWQVLASDRCVIGSFPQSRRSWPAAADFPGIDQGGFVADADAFDAAFFRMSPAEAQITDPQQRMLLELAWASLEDAGIVPTALKGSNTGVFVGASNCDYSRLVQEAGVEVEGHHGVGSSLAILANRISYFFDLSGPSLVVDTACSSSLVALHAAVQSLRSGECTTALVGGVNLICHPDLSIAYHKAGMLAADGRCKVFDAEADGYVRSEGAVVLLLKPLQAAIADRNQIHAVIRGSAINHGGLAGGLTVPNPQKQSELLQAAWRDAAITAQDLTYIEAHGTGTSLGDPIEIQGIVQAASAQPGVARTATCAISSVKSNLGHLESAAGITGLLKIILSLRHQQLPASVNFKELNPKIRLTDTPFFIQTGLGTWVAEQPRLAAVSSFGSGGANAHVVVQEHPRKSAGRVPQGHYLFVLSAASVDGLRAYVSRVIDWLGREASDADFADAIYTWQVGRSAMKHRLAIKVKDRADLLSKLQRWSGGHGELADCWFGQAAPNDSNAKRVWETRSGRQLVEQALLDHDTELLGTVWVTGIEIEWHKSYARAGSVTGVPETISLPTYPFARDRFWIESAPSRDAVVEGRALSTPPAGVLHPLLHINSSDLRQQSYTATFTGDEFFLADHQVCLDGRNVEKVLPGVAYLEMARAAVEQAMPSRPEGATFELRNTVWVQPIVVSGKREVRIALLESDDEAIDYEIYSEDGDGELVHGQGRAILSSQPAPARLDLEQLAGQMEQGRIEATEVYASCARIGLTYGPSFQAITAIQRGNEQVLAHLRLPESVEREAGDYVLHPSLMDGALQAAVQLIAGGAERGKQPPLPFALESLRIISPCTRQMAAWVRYSPGARAADAVVKLDIDLCDERGNVCVQMHGFSSRVPGKAAASLLAAPVWQAAPIEGPAGAGSPAYLEHHIAMCELPDASVEKLAALLPHGRYLLLDAAPQKDIAQRYSEHALACFERIQSILRDKPAGKVLLQIVAAGDREGALFAGLSALLRTAALENPQLAGQLILVPAATTAEELVRRLEDEKTAAADTLVRYEQGGREVVRWQEAPADVDTPAMPFKDHGVYLITGGTGAIGVLFAKEILEQAANARVVLTGRSPLTAEKRACVEGLSAQGGRVSYRQLDLGDLQQVTQLIAAIGDDYGRLDGILHSAGMIADDFLLKKSSSQFSAVLEPKVTGTFNLDQASRNAKLDFFVLFSSVVGATGNVGQADYASANAFMDHFAAYRNRLVTDGQRHGRTRSINWPLWQAGGMGIDGAAEERLAQTTGTRSMPTAAGMQAFRRSLALPYGQVLVMEGDAARIRRALMANPAPSAAPQTAAPVAVSAIDAESLAERTQDYLRRQLSGLVKLPSHKIDPQAAFEEYGIDSILSMKLTNQLEETFGSLAKTLFFEYRTLRELTGYFVAQHAPQLTSLFAASANRAAHEAPAVAQVVAPAPAAPVPSRRFAQRRSAAPRPAPKADAIAIIGVSGRYPQAVDIDAYWRNLRDGRDCITEVPRERWDWRQYFTEDRSKSGRHYSKWGGFMEGVDKFDPMFFNIAPREAKYIDPQERVFLQHAWMAVEDAGYTRATLQLPHEGDLPGQVGVYAGVMWSEYQLFGAEAGAEDMRMGFAGNLASIANRVSYVLDLHGPSLTLDTMCSSSLTAIHFACQDLKLGRTSLAIAGGVNVSVHPQKYLMLSVGQFISSDGHCQSFGEGGDGYIPGEGVGVVVLKRLSDAERDGDHIYGIIRGSALTHGGKTNGYTVPNPQAQTSAISRALAEAHVDARHISYIEAHGTGTKLGDPIEIAALSKAFEQSSQGSASCLIGSAKSNIGHCESAAGIAGLTKILLQMQHQEIVPSLHSAQLNPYIDFDRTPFVVNQSLRAWEQPVLDGRKLPRIAGLSSFGAGGSNAHMIVEEYPAPAAQPMRSASVAILLSARTPEQLRQKARHLLDFVLARVSSVDLAAMAYTLQVGREAMEERLGFVVSSPQQLVEKLQSYVAGNEDLEDTYHGQVKRNKEALAVFSADADLQQTVGKWIANRKVARLLDLWVKGLELDWSKLYSDDRPRRVSLPTYPFAKERYWIETAVKKEAAGRRTAASGNVAARLRAMRGRRTASVTAEAVIELPAPSAAPALLEAVKVVTPERKEIILSGPREAVAAPVERKKRGAISLAAPGALTPATGSSENTARRPAITLTKATPAPAPGSTSPAHSSIRLYDDGDGMFAIEIAPPVAYSQAMELIAPLLHTLQRVRQEASLKVLTLRGMESWFLRGGREVYNQAAEQQLFAAVGSFPYPVIAIVKGDAVGTGLLLAALCDFMVCDEDALYGYIDVQHQLVPTPAEAMLLGARFGAAPARELLYTTTPLSGRQLRARGLAAPMASGTEVEAYAQRLAGSLATKSQVALRLLKQHLTRHLAGLADGLTRVEAATAEELLATVPTIASPSPHIELTTPVEQVLLIRFGSAGATDLSSLIAGLGPILAAVRQEPHYKAIVLAGDHPALFAEAIPEELVMEAQRLLAQSEIPVVAALTGDAKGNGWLIAELCDGCVYSREGSYSAAGIGSAAVATFGRRFGNVAAAELLLTGGQYSGSELQALARGMLVTEQQRVLATAIELAASWARLPRPTLAAWKKQTATALQQQELQSFPAEQNEHRLADPITRPTAIALRSNVVTATAHPDGIVVVKMEDRDAKNMFSEALVEGVTEAFAHIGATAAYKVVILTGYDTYFASGGTKESLLAIQQGKAKFTDFNIYQSALDCRLPVIAAMQGHGIGAGWSLGMFADVVLLSEEGRYLSPYMNYGFTPGAGATWVLPEKIGQDVARESLLTAQPYSGRELKARGVSVRVLPAAAVYPAAFSLAKQMAQMPRGHLIALKQQLTAHVHEPLVETYRLELAMHEKTFVGQSDTLARLQTHFHRETQRIAPVELPKASVEVRLPAAAATRSGDGDVLRSVATTLRTLLAAELQVRESDIDDGTQFVELGLDSISGVTWIRKINERFQTSIEATKVYSYPTLAELSRYVKAEAETRGTLPVPAAPPALPLAASMPAPMPVAAATRSGDGDVLRGVAATLRTLLAGELQVRESDIDDGTQFVELGLDSISGVTWIRKINEKYQTAIEATKIYSYPTLAELTGYVKAEAEARGTLPSPVAPAAGPMPAVLSAAVAPQQNFGAVRATTKLPSRRSRPNFRRGASAPEARPSQSIAVIGMAGQFPQARNLDEFWRNIAGGRNCITQVPPQRWDVDTYYQPGEPVPGRTTSQWAGTLAEYDLFDPLFFSISPTEAESMDPQQRLFLQACWHGIENAGYAARSLSGSKCGVFVGCTNGDYHQGSREHQLSAQGFTGSAMSILAARISYFLNLRGACVSIDTACSSSLMAVAQACDSLISGGSELALAGGVYVMTGPDMHIKTSQAGMLSPDGKCFTFDQRSNGFVPGEGVGVVLLKRLEDAERDRDIIHAVIEGWGANQDGKTNGITAPNPESQTRLQQEVYERYQIDPSTIQLIEAHGTGTKLGDPIEVEGLKNAFKKYTRDQEYCALGSVKSNIGHCLAAAGIAGLIKLVLALKHKQLPPTINFERLNEHIDLTGSPFYVNTRLREWGVGAAQRRLAATSSFGFSGTNAHVVLGDYRPRAEEAPTAIVTQDGNMIVPLSAKTAEQLRQQAGQLLHFIREEAPSTDLLQIAYTLQVGREPMEYRLGIMAGSVAELAAKLESYLNSERRIEGLYQGEVSRGQDSTSILSQDDDVKDAIVSKWVGERKLSKLAELWVNGLELDWNRFYGQVKPQRIPLPMYPFAKERYWIEAAPAVQVAVARDATAVLHPLLQRNTSDLSEQRYSSAFTGDEFFLADHRVRTDGSNVRKVLPGVAYLEMARAAIAQAWPAQLESSTPELRNTVWLKPFIVGEPREVSIALFATDDDQRVDYEIYSTEAGEEVVHCQGQAVFAARAEASQLDLGQLRRQMSKGRLNASDVYGMFDTMGLHYGPAHRGIIALELGEGQLLAQLRLPAGIEPGRHEYVLHPSLMDSALQATIGLIADREHVPSSPSVPFVVESLRVFSPCTREMTAWVRTSSGSNRGDRIVKLDIDLCDPRGTVCAQIRGFASRALDGEERPAHHGAAIALVQDEPRLTIRKKGSFDDSFYDRLVADVMNHAMSVEEAVELG